MGDEFLSLLVDIGDDDIVHNGISYYEPTIISWTGIEVAPVCVFLLSR